MMQILAPAVDVEPFETNIIDFIFIRWDMYLSKLKSHLQKTAN